MRIIRVVDGEIVEIIDTPEEETPVSILPAEIVDTAELALAKATTIKGVKEAMAPVISVVRDLIS